MATESLTNNDNKKEDSVSLSLSDDQNDNGGITISLKPSDTTNNKKNLGVTKNRAKFMKTAPSLMKLLSIGSSTSPTQEQLNTNINTEDDNNEPDFFKKSSVVTELIAEYKNAATDTQSDDANDIQTLASEAANEFQLLAIQNDELFKEKEQFKQRYDDLYNKMQELYTQLKDIELYKDENQRLITENSKYQSQLIIFEQEKNIMQETIDNLKDEINSLTVENNNDIAPDIYNENNNEFNTSQNSNNIMKNNERLMTQIANITKEKNELEVVLDEYKTNNSNNNNEINKLTIELKDSKNEIQRLSNDLTETQNKYIKLQQTKQQQTNKYQKQLSINSDKIVNEYKAKQIELLQTIQNQKKVIGELQKENDMFSKKDAAKKKLAMHQRLRTQHNVFVNDSVQYDEDPFGGNDEVHDSFMNYNESFEEVNDEQINEDIEHEYIGNDKVIEEYKQKQIESDRVIEECKDKEIELFQTIENQKNVIEELKRERDERINSLNIENNDENVNGNNCGCMVQFFNKFKKNGNKASSPMTVKNDYVLMK